VYYFNCVGVKLLLSSNAKIDAITARYKDLPYMRHEQATLMRKIILENCCQHLCELGHYHGKSSVYIGACVEEQGFGKLYTYDFQQMRRTPSCKDLIQEFNLEKWVEPRLSIEGFIWDLAQQIKQGGETFDFCYLDGGHIFHHTAMAFLLIDKLLKPNSILIFDDYLWTIEKTVQLNGPEILNDILYRGQTIKQHKIPQVKMACDLFVDPNKYELLDDNFPFDWAIYRKLY
jgi:predicted O-methyltransferase YrrM